MKGEQRPQGGHHRVRGKVGALWELWDQRVNGITQYGQVMVTQKKAAVIRNSNFIFFVWSNR